MRGKKGKAKKHAQKKTKQKKDRQRRAIVCLGTHLSVRQLVEGDWEK